MSTIQKRNLAIIIFLGFFVFLLFFWPNGQNAADEQMLRGRSQDEPIIYPIVLRMLSYSQNIHEAWGKLIIYGDYHYGYPFYFLSFLVLLPVKFIFGNDFPTQTQLNLMLLRQFISVLPLILGAGVMTFLQTRFLSLFKSTFLFCFLLSIGGIVRNNINWWHPDALSVLAIVLTLFFLEQDLFKFGRNFYLAAGFCGMATAIKLQGIFFAPSILVYLLYGWSKKSITTTRMIRSALGFILVMSLVVVLSNPFLFYSGPRQDLVNIQQYKMTELSQGYAHDNPIYNQKGPYWWHWTLEQWYGHPLFWGFSILSMLLACWKGKRKLINRLILLWTLPLSIYLLYFVAVKPDHYWLPVVLPLFSVVLNIPIILSEIPIPQLKNTSNVFLTKVYTTFMTKESRLILRVLFFSIVLIEMIFYLNQDIRLYLSFINE
jgi:hypothetical protein